MSILNRLNPIGSICGAVTDLLYPAHCAICRHAVMNRQSRPICRACDAQIRRVQAPCCTICSRPFDAIMDSAICANCSDRELHFEAAVGVIRNGPLIRDLIHRFKYSGHRDLMPLLGGWIVEGLAEPRLKLELADALVPVPLHPTRRRERGFNQAELLASALSKASGKPVRRCLRRTRSTTTQTQFDRKQRMRNLRDAFELIKNADVTDLDLILVDDVLTTGATLDECARVLMLAGAASVRAITVVRG